MSLDWPHYERYPMENSYKYEYTISQHHLMARPLFEALEFLSQRDEPSEEVTLCSKFQIEDSDEDFIKVLKDLTTGHGTIMEIKDRKMSTDLTDLLIGDYNRYIEKTYPQMFDFYNQKLSLSEESS